MDKIAKQVNKKILTLILPLFLSYFMVTIFLGCSQDKSRSIVYNAEKLYHQASKLMERALIKPDLNDKTITKTIKDAFHKTSNYCWTHLDSIPVNELPEENKKLTSVAYLSSNQLVRIYFAERKYDSVSIILKRFLMLAQPSGNALLSSQLNLATATQSLGNLNEAMIIYHSIIDTFHPPVDNDGKIIDRVLNLPLGIISTYSRINNIEAANEAGNSAIDYYQRLIAEWPNSDLELASHGNLARLYFDRQEWDKSIDNLSRMLDTAGLVDIEAAMMIADITLEGKKEYQKAISLYDSLLIRVNDSTQTPLILLKKGMTNYQKSDFEACRQLMLKISDEYETFFRTNPNPQKYIALAFESLGNWDRAENEFQALIDNYPATEAAFDAFLIIAKHYQKIGNPSLMTSWYRRGEDFYFQMAGRYKNTAVEASAMSYAAEIARLELQWQKAANLLEQLYNKFPRADIGRRSLMTAASIQREKLNNIPKADSLLNQFRAEPIPVQDSKNNVVLSDDNK